MQPTGGTIPEHTQEFFSPHYLQAILHELVKKTDFELKHIELCNKIDSLEQAFSAREEREQDFFNRILYLEKQLTESGLITDSKKISAGDNNKLQVFFRQNIPTKIVNKLSGAMIDFAGAAYFLIGIGAFLALLLFSYNLKSTQHYLSPTPTNIQSSSRNVTCSSQLTVNTVDMQLDESGNWDSSSNFLGINNLKQLKFQAYSGTFQQFQKTIAQLNDCIDNANHQMSLLPTLAQKLLVLGFLNCSATNVTLTIDIDWASVFNIVYGNWAEYHVSNGTARASTDQKPNSNLLKIVIPPQSAQFFSLQINDLLNVRINLDSMARCLAVNEGVLPFEALNDVIGVQGEPTVAGYYFTKTTDSDLMLFYSQSHSCGVYVFSQLPLQNTKTSLTLWPSFSKTPHTLNNTDYPPQIPSTIDFNVSEGITVAREGILRVAFFGQGLGVINSGGYSTLTKKIMSLAKIPLPTPDNLPFVLETPGIYLCSETYKTNSLSTAFGSAFANTGVVLQGFISFVVIAAPILWYKESVLP